MPVQPPIEFRSLFPANAKAQRLPVHDLHVPWLDLGRVQISVLRADLCDPLVSGNKFFKLRYNLAAARESGHDTLLSFGGVWSNHLHALAAAGQRSGMRTIGVVRGDRSSSPTKCLAEAQAFGMHLHFVSRSDYRERNSPELLTKLQDLFGPCFVVPEGGANLQGIRGCQELLTPELAAQYNHVVLACGTGTTLLGLVTSIRTPVIGIQVLKGATYLEREIRAGLLRHGLQAVAPWAVFDQFHGGGYARVDVELLEFLGRLERDTGLPLEPVYIGKVFMALQALTKAGHFAAGSRILVVHGGGLQGCRGFK